MITINPDEKLMMVANEETGNLLTEEDRDKLREFANFFEEKFGQEVYAVYLNDDREDGRRLHGINFIFKKAYDNQKNF